jgi:hypothetical protein
LLGTKGTSDPLREQTHRDGQQMNGEVSKTMNAVFGRVDLQHTIPLSDTSLAVGLVHTHCLQMQRHTSYPRTNRRKLGQHAMTLIAVREVSSGQ